MGHFRRSNWAIFDDRTHGALDSIKKFLEVVKLGYEVREKHREEKEHRESALQKESPILKPTDEQITKYGMSYLERKIDRKPVRSRACSCTVTSTLSTSSARTGSLRGGVLIRCRNFFDVIDDDNVKWNILDLHEFEPELLFECDKNIRQAAAEVIG